MRHSDLGMRKYMLDNEEIMFLFNDYMHNIKNK